MKISWAIPDIQQPEKRAIKKVIDNGWYTQGPEVKKFEETVASYLNIKYSIGVNNGTAALDIALKCIGIKPGDDVIIPALTYITTGTMILFNNANPVFVDIDNTLNIDTSLIEEKITDKTKAIINIDLGGNVSNYYNLLKISEKNNILLIVDGAQSFGSEYHGVKCCTHGIINTTSFHAAKILTTIEGGMVFTNNKEYFIKAQAIRNQGESAKYIHEYLGNNYRMMDLIAVLGNSQLQRLDNTINQRIEKANYYKEHLKNVCYPEELSDTKNCYFFFLILTNNRDKLNKYLNKNGVETRITYPMPINEQPIFRKNNQEIYLCAKKISESIISLPIHHRLTRAEQDYIIKKINNFRG